MVFPQPCLSDILGVVQKCLSLPLYKPFLQVRWVFSGISWVDLRNLDLLVRALLECWQSVVEGAVFEEVLTVLMIWLLEERKLQLIPF